jgi:membrane fusion protein, multidrug efflux system
MSRWKWLIALVVLVIVAIIGYRLYSSSAAGLRRGAGAHDDSAPVAVTVVPVAREDVPIYLDALGTVQALNTVTVRPQVAGQLMSLSFKEGQEIKKDSVIAVIDPRTYQGLVDQAVAKKRQDEALLAGARSTLSRYEDLIKKNYVAAQDLENQHHTVKQLEATVGADDAAIENARVQLSFTSIRAPIDGLAGIRQVDIGNILSAGDTSAIVVLTQMHPLNVVFTLPEQNLDLVRGSDPDSLKVSALDRTDNHVLSEGKLAVIDNQIDTTTGTVKLKAEFTNEKSVLWPGQFVNVHLQVRTVTGGLVVPSQAVQRGPDGSYVYTVQGDNTVNMQPVQTGAEAGENKLLILTGIKEGDRVVTEGQFRLKPGTKVQALAPGEAPPADAAPATDEKKPNAQRTGRRKGG